MQRESHLLTSVGLPPSYGSFRSLQLRLREVAEDRNMKCWLPPSGMSVLAPLTRKFFKKKKKKSRLDYASGQTCTTYLFCSGHWVSDVSIWTTHWQWKYLHELHLRKTSLPFWVLHPLQCPAFRILVNTACSSVMQTYAKLENITQMWNNCTIGQVRSTCLPDPDQFIGISIFVVYFLPLSSSLNWLHVTIL